MGYIAGLLFGLGLAVSGMTDPARVLGFLDLFGAWDPTLMFVLGGAVITNFIGYRLAMRRPNPLFASAFQVPTRRDLDGRLIGGSALFGIGWGLSGYCPGPAFASVVGITAPLAAMLAAMVAGWFLARALPSRS
ncbi:YeeE/YedE family protein [Halomonas nitroreducens]|uniref:YeeE/YedE family protein n=2 Tax=Halomonas nitroreducens TaxID=447425 RepID=A0A3S0JZK2_9GAMM|nr:YeeE/YedE family protein [Halomonas nitroreducens]